MKQKTLPFKVCRFLLKPKETWKKIFKLVNLISNGYSRKNLESASTQQKNIYFWQVLTFPKMSFFGKMQDSPDSPTFANQFCKDLPDSPTFAKQFGKYSPDLPD